MLRMFSSSLLVVLGLLLAAWLSPADALGCSGGNGTCFLVGAGGNSNSTSAWSQTSGGGSCTCVPATNDTVILDSASGQLTVNAAFSIGSLLADGTGQNANGSYTGVMTHNTATTITINGASNGNGVVSLVSGMTYTPASTSSLWTFVNTGAVTLKTGGKNFSAVTVNSGPGSVLLGDNFSGTAVAGAAFTVTSGTFDTGSFTFTAVSLQSNNSNNRTITLRGGLVKLGGNVTAGLTILTFATATGLVLNKNSANIEIVVPTTATIAGAGYTWNPAGQSFNGIILDANNSFNTGFGISSSATYTSWTVGSGWTILGSILTASNVSGAVTLAGTAAHPNTLGTTSAGNIWTMTAGSCTATFTSFWNVTIPTGCTATQSNNLGGVAGVNITQPQAGAIIGG